MNAISNASTVATMPHPRLANKSPTAAAPTAVAWSLGNEKSVVLSTKTCTLVIASYGRSRSTGLPMSWPMPRARICQLGSGDATLGDLGSLS